MTREIIDTRIDAEEARKKKDFLTASSLAKKGLGYEEEGQLREEEVSRLDDEALSLTIDLAEIVVDAEKSIAMHAKTARKAKVHIDEAVEAMEPLYRERVYDRTEINKRAEMARSYSMVAVAATPLVSREQKHALLTQGRNNLETMQMKIDRESPLYGLMDIEIAIIGKRLGEKLDREKMKEGLLKLVATSDDPHRVASAAVWVWDWSERAGDKELEKLGKDLVENIVKQKPEWEKIGVDAQARKWKELARE